MSWTKPGDHLDIAKLRPSGFVEEAPFVLCQTCSAHLGYGATENIGHVLNHYWESGKEQKMYPCPDCNEAQVNERRQNKLVGESGLEKHRVHGFESSAPYIGQEAAWGQALQFSQAPRGWLIFEGTWGAGKTFIARCIGNAVLDLGRPVVFRNVPLLLQELRSTMRKDSEVSMDARLEGFCECPLLILDDYGAQQDTAWSTETLYSIINARWWEKRPTVITRNPDHGEIDKRVWSRMADSDLCQLIRFKARAA